MVRIAVFSYARRIILLQGGSSPTEGEREVAGINRSTGIWFSENAFIKGNANRIITWQEDKPETDIVRINLSDYVYDVDNEDSELSWQVIIQDTSQLDEDFPLASVVVGPGTPKSVENQLMKD